MPEKTVREMNDRERLHYSLAARVFHSALMGSVVLGLVALLIGLGLYTNALVGQYIGEAFGSPNRGRTNSAPIFLTLPRGRTIVPTPIREF